MTVAAETTWNKPALDRHAHVSQALAEILEEAPKAAISLCNYLFRVCIDGKFEEIELYSLPLGANRTTEKRSGRPYAKNTLREALKILVRLGLVIIDKSYGKGVFRLTISHPGKKRPFERVRNLTTRTKKRSSEQKIDQIGASNDVNSFAITEEINKKAEQAAATRICFFEKKETATSTEDEFLPTVGVELRGAENYQDNDAQSQIVNTEAEAICASIREVMPLNPQLKAQALKYTLTQVQAALSLYQERCQKKPIPNPQGFLTDCLRGQWWTEKRDNTTSFVQYPPELVRWYEWAKEAGIVDGRPLQHCPGATTRGGVEQLQVVIPISPKEFRPSDIVPFRYLHWREAMALYPLEDVTAGQTDAAPDEPTPSEMDLEAYYQVMEDYEPDPEIQRLIQESLGQHGV
ncbi:hypothetical protein Glo7428_5228 (plasmid) [Gloeocapsa sp. PCC 7428]|uniref:hypothetical protein n=1 Tax=Gloeocapsa sp. PCC 7428 TaxID=1173026 RepID=UPI0002A5F9B5|nr:hypothetical protein [Gloeocapsa sp. PCC 7428]AFZ33605.1 hypothetical protein Glo7428_5228 [Gloeocapsa sp. PCC 7428]